MLNELPSINDDKQDLIPLQEMLVTDISPINKSLNKDDIVAEPVTLTKELAEPTTERQMETNAQRVEEVPE